MRLQQLIELAILDAMGLLDDDEQRSFDSAYRVAAPAVQAQVRREQTRLSRIESLLPAVTPPAGLRAAVLEAVRREILAAELAEPVVGTLPQIFKSRGVSAFWRAASVGLAAAVLVLGITTFNVVYQFNGLTQALQSGEIVTAMNRQAEGAVKDIMFNRDTQRVVFQPVANGFKGQASVFLNPEWDRARFFFAGIKPREGKPLRLAIVDAEDHIVKVLTEIPSDGRLDHKAIELKPNTKARLAILGDGGDGENTILSRGELPGSSL